MNNKKIKLWLTTLLIALILIIAGIATKLIYNHINESESGKSKKEHTKEDDGSKYIIMNNSHYYVDGDFTLYTEYVYDEDGLLAMCIERDEDGEVMSTTTYEYDENGNCICQTRYNAYEERDYSFIYEFDSNGNEIVSQFCDYTGSIISIHEKEYDEDNRLTYIYDYNELGHMEMYHEYKYDKEGRVKNIISYQHGKEIVSVNVTYTGSREKQNVHVNYADIDYLGCARKYDKHGNIIKEKLYNTSGMITDVIKYEYEKVRDK